MKSIKQKAEEYTSDIENHVTNNAANRAYQEGANYVLECIEKTIPSSDDVLENHTKCKSAIFRLQSIIEQLKK